MRFPALPACAAAILLSACATQPLYQTSAATVQATPRQVAETPEQYRGEVVWGGSIVEVRNLADHSEIEIFSWPLDAAQRPRNNDAGGGRFIALMPGYAERMDYPVGAMITVNGELAGVRSGRVGEAPYVFPLVRVASSHLWRDEEPGRRPNVHVGIGVGVGIR